MKKAVILAAGDSTRMLPLSANLPKHLLPVGGKPLIFHTLEALSEGGIEETLVIYGYHGDALREAIDTQDWSGMNVSYVEQRERKGTAHAVGHARDFVGSDSFLLIHGDVLAGPGMFRYLMKFHRERKFGLTISLYPVDEPSAFGIVSTDGDRAVELVEKPAPGEAPGNLANAGIYIATDAIWDAIDETGPSERGEYEITDSIRRLMRAGRVGAFRVQTWWIDVGRPWDILKANRLLLNDISDRIDGTVEEGAILKGPVIVEKGATVRSGAYIQGPAYIGQGSVIGPNCYIRPHTALCGRVKIGNAVEIKNCVIMDGTNVSHLSYVGDSVIGRNVNFGAGTITANLRHDGRNIRATLKGKRVDSGRRKLGVIVGDDVRFGIGTSIGPGVIVHQGARTTMGVIVSRDIPPYTMVIAEQPHSTVKLESLR